ncbi:MAG TPA: glycosyltransferase family 2 protein [Chloroflexota bacterium]|nr:glycosyltransferase family 2 protein [Chloroflexota bacterium]
MGLPTVSVVIPAFNEESAVADVVNEYREALSELGGEFEIIVVDDGSTDGTRTAATNAGADVIGPPSNMGYGHSLRRGIRAARHEWVLITDADDTYPATTAARLVEIAEHYDMVVAARTGRHFHGPPLRRLARWLLILLASFVTGRHIPDVNSGLRIFRRDAVLRYFDILSTGFSFSTGLTLAMISDGLGVHFISSEYRAREGKSKIRAGRDSLRMLQVIVQAAVRHNPIKIFTLLTAFTWAVAAVLIVLWTIGGSGSLLLAGLLGIFFGILIFGQGLIAEASRGRRS